MDKQNKQVISIIGSALTLTLTACGGNNSLDTFENLNVDNVVEISTNDVVPVTLGASLNDYYVGNVTLPDEDTINNENMTTVSETIVELEVSEIPVPPVETIPTTVTTTRQMTVTKPYEYLYYMGEYGYVSVESKSSLNIRKTPSKNATSLGNLTSGREVYIESAYINSSNEVWYYISYPKYGYVSSQYITLCGGDKEKPVIYLYPPKETKVSVKLSLNGRFTYTYPEYNDGWNVTAYPDGTLIDADNNEYSYLFWEGNGHVDYDLSKGFVVERSNVTKFLKEKLLYMGLTQKEANEFIVYWSPRLMKNPYSFVAFQGKEYEDYAKLSISPKPDSILRVFMVFKAVDKNFTIPQQELSTFKRVGFSVVEWGGEELSC